MEFTQNDWGQRDIINKIKILIKRGTDAIHAVILTKYQKYPSTKILKHASVLAKVNKLPSGSVPNRKPHGANSITIHVHTLTLLDISHEQKE